MNEDCVTSWSIVLAALFLRGMPGSSVSRRQWPEIVRALREEQVTCGDAASALRRRGLWEAGLALDEPRLVAAAEEAVLGDRCLTVLDAEYPARWVRVLREAAPPALWRSGRAIAGPCVSVVGSRAIPLGVRRFAFGAGAAAARGGFVLVSGGAHGCDSTAEAGALSAGGSVIRVLPHGLKCDGREGLMVLSACAPWEEFSRGNAMERNALIYAASDRSLVVACRFREGGTWHGAVDALRRRLTRLFVRRASGEAGLEALAALGATPVKEPGEFIAAEFEAFEPRTLFRLA